MRHALAGLFVLLVLIAPSDPGDCTRQGGPKKHRRFAANGPVVYSPLPNGSQEYALNSPRSRYYQGAWGHWGLMNQPVPQNNNPTVYGRGSFYSHERLSAPSRGR